MKLSFKQGPSKLTCAGVVFWRFQVKVEEGGGVVVGVVSVGRTMLRSCFIAAASKDKADNRVMMQYFQR